MYMVQRIHNNATTTDYYGPTSSIERAQQAINDAPPADRTRYVIVITQE